VLQAVFVGVHVLVLVTSVCVWRQWSPLVWVLGLVVTAALYGGTVIVLLFSHLQQLLALITSTLAVCPL